MRIRVTMDKVFDIKGLGEPEEIDTAEDERLFGEAEDRAALVLCDYLADQDKDTLIEWMSFNDSSDGMSADEVEVDITLYPEDEEVPDDGVGEWSTYTRG